MSYQESNNNQLVICALHNGLPIKFECILYLRIAAAKNRSIANFKLKRLRLS